MHSPKIESGPVALYAQLASILREKIMSGAWPTGYEIPTLEELSREYSLARVTIRQAIQILVGDGLLSSHRGRRTFVTFKPTNADPTPLFVSVDFMRSVTGSHLIEPLSLDEVSAEYLGAVFCGHAAGSYMRFRKVDFEDGTPYSISTHFIAKDIFDKFPKGAERKVKIARLVRDHAREVIRDCRERISVVSVDHNEAASLGCPYAAPAGKVMRIFVDGSGHVLYFGTLLFRNDRFGIERDITTMIVS